MRLYKNFHVYKNTLLVREINDGKEKKLRIPIKPSYYFVTEKDSEYKSVFNDNLIKLDFDSQYEAKEWFKDYESMRSKIFGYPNYEYTVINQEYPGELAPKFNIDLMTIGIVDIETTVEHGFPDPMRGNEAINLISLGLMGNGHKGKIKCFGYGDAIVTDPDAEYVKCHDEKDMLKSFINYWNINNIDIITGWNIAEFDIPYIIKRVEIVLGDDWVKALSPWKLVFGRNAKNDFGKEIVKYDIVGINVFDYLELYKKFTYSDQESFKLDYIAMVELGDKKVEYDCSFKDLYTKYYQMFVDYNIHDVRLIIKLEKKLGFISLGSTIVYKAKVAFQDVFTTVRVWDVIIANALSGRNKFVPTFLTHSTSGGDYGGGYVKPPLIGFYQWLASIDATSLYPSIERSFNTSTETILPVSEFIPLTPDDVVNKTPKFQEACAKAKRLNATLAANGAMFSKEFQGIIPELNELYFNQRKTEKELGKRYERAAASIASILAERGVTV